jgi:hypothetical protein
MHFFQECCSTNQPAAIAGGASFQVTAGADNHVPPYAILIDGGALGAAVPAGPHLVELRVFLSGALDLPVVLKVNGVDLGQQDVVHDEQGLAPIINSVSPSEGFVLGAPAASVRLGNTNHFSSATQQHGERCKARQSGPAACTDSCSRSLPGLLAGVPC